MVIPAVGLVVVFPFPFPDLSHYKQRPALILANTEKGDWILAQVTSKSYSDQKAVELNLEDFSVVLNM